MAKIGIGLIGCGSRLRGVVKSVLASTEEVDVVALFDTSEESVQKAKEAFNEEAKVYDDFNELVNDQNISWVMIGSWNCFHAEQAIAAFKAGKHVFCEKPLALSIDDCIAMKEAWKEGGRLFSIGFTLRYSPHYDKIKEILSSGAIGKIISMEFNETLDFNHGGYIHADWRRKTEWAGSHLLEKCCHDIDLVNWMVESTAVKAASFGGCDFFLPENEHYVEKLGKNKNGDKAFQTWSKRNGGASIPGNIVNPFNADKDIIDNQVAIIEYANGVRATFHTNCISAIPERRMYICGTEGALRADVISGELVIQKIGFETVIEDMATTSKGGHGGGDSILGESIANSMLHGQEPKSSLEEGLRAAITVFGIDEALKTGQVVDLKPLWEKANIEIL
ncbi:MAG: oxidoreductase [Planctomycetota bacterium]|nr:MAG: oxidoreductase [Planctomycetota bacterium]